MAGWRWPNASGAPAQSSPTPEPKPDKEGICCPECGTCEHVVKATRKTENGLLRRRECPKGHRFSTVELVWGEGVSREDALSPLTRRALKRLSDIAFLLGAPPETLARIKRGEFPR